MNLRIANISEEHLKVCLTYNVWGADKNSFRKWEIGDYLVMKIKNKYGALAKISGKPYKDNLMIWDNGLFDHRIPIEFIHVLDKNDWIDHDNEFKDLFIQKYGIKYGWTILNKVIIDKYISNKFLTKFNVTDFKY